MNKKLPFEEQQKQADFPKFEQEILEYWEKNQIFEKSLDKGANEKQYTFYDGPPFATGTPHYGHIVASTMKDVVPRYFTMQGKTVPRIWGWDCHGLPIENIAEKDLGIKNKQEIEKLGVGKFNNYCRSKVLEYADDWEKVIRRLGRWADMKNAYKTMDKSYMESVWWAFKRFYDEGLIYEGYRSMHICPRCQTTLSQTEVAEGYKDVKDLSAIIKFELVDEPGTHFLAWTTTPWTLLGNVALAISDKIKYKKLKIKDKSGKETQVIIASKRVDEVVKQKYREITELPGSELIGKKYKQIFSLIDSIKNSEKAFKVQNADFVNTDEGTGIVHIAPAFGEDDLNLSKDLDLPLVQHIGIDGIIKDSYGEFSGLSVKPSGDSKLTDKKIIEYLENKGLIFSSSEYTHSYPHCWRCETPLLNYATNSWFIAVTKIREKAIELSQDINWSPAHIKEGRFGKWLEGAKDWSISRQRYWATPIPVWRCDCGQIKVIGSADELEKLSGKKIDDLHKEYVDTITIGCDKCSKTMKRVADVLDCWFESGSMPFAQFHYPFEKKDVFKKSFPADFIGEGVDQTRAWFYCLHLISTVLNKSLAYKNVIANGIVLAEDGKKMSKRLQNYPDPMEMFNKYGADIVRYYLISSTVMAGENLNFSEKELSEIHRGMFRMLWNSFGFFILYANSDDWRNDGNDPVPENILDRWILSEITDLVENVNKSMKKYDIVRASRHFQGFIDNLSNWYIRRSRKRFWKSDDNADKNQAYKTLYYSLVTLTKLMAPFTPFISEKIFKVLTGKLSVHLESYPIINQKYKDKQVIINMRRARKIVEESLMIRNKHQLKVRQPLSKLEYLGEELDHKYLEIIAEEVNVKKVVNVSSLDKNNLVADSVSLNQIISEDLKLEGQARELVRQLQEARKKANFTVSTRVAINYNSASSGISEVINKHQSYLKDELLATKILSGQPKEFDYQEEISGCDFWLTADDKTT